MNLAILFLLAGTPALQAQEHNPYTSPANVARGKQLYGGHCAPCHGPAGEGGRGPNLARTALPRAATEEALFTVIRDGLPGTEMPRGSALDDREIWQVAAFVRGLGQTEAEELPGSPANGARLFRDKGGCLKCHAVGTEGGGLGPPLTEIGLRRSAAFLRSTLADPAAAAPPDFQMVDFETNDGRRVSGILIAEDTFSIQLRDLSERPLSFWKKDLSNLKRSRGKTPMPAYRGTFSDAELEDLVAYLVSLRGAQ
ncbi:MAG TPA: c-type cytochrome [Candidatus Acidoferrales bacterium]|nr:c-type cytochrome [Candidatus Acidoferrales bacterium]